MLCPVCGKSVDSISQIASLCPTCEASEPKKEIQEEQDNDYNSSDGSTFRTSEYEFAGFWLRVAAHIVDGAVIYIIASVIMMFFLTSFVTVLTTSYFFSFLRSSLIYLMFTHLIAVVLSILFVLIVMPPLFECSSMQGTIGKYLIGLRVTKIDGKSRIGFFRALIRSFIRGILFIGTIFCSFTQRKQSLHDIFCDTLVIRHRKVPPFRIFCYVVGSLVVTTTCSRLSNKDKDQEFSTHSTWTINNESLGPITPQANEFLSQFEKHIGGTQNMGPANNQIKVAQPAPVQIPTNSKQPSQSQFHEITKEQKEQKEKLERDLQRINEEIKKIQQGNNPTNVAQPTPNQFPLPSEVEAKKELDPSKMSEFDRRVFLNKKKK